MKARTARLALAAVSVGVSLLVAEGAWRLFFRRPGFTGRSELSAPGMVVAHPRRGYTLAPGWSGRMKNRQFDVPFRTDALGCRVPVAARLDEAPAADGAGARTFTVLTLGDSFTFGHGIEAERSWPEQLGERLGPRLRASLRVRIVNGGVSGYNMAQVRDWAEELAPRVAPDLIVLGLFVNGAERMKNPYVLHEGDVVRDRERPRIRAVDGGFLRTPMNRPSLQSLHFWLGEHSYVGAALLEQSFRAFGWASNAPGHYWRRLRGSSARGARGPTEEGERAYLAPLLDEVGRIDALARSQRAPLVVLLIHVQREDGTFREIDARFSAIAEQYCKARGIPVLDPTPLFQERAHGAPVFRYTPRDAHWSAAAQGLAAEELERFLEKAGLVPAGRVAEAAPASVVPRVH